MKASGGEQRHGLTAILSGEKYRRLGVSMNMLRYWREFSRQPECANHHLRPYAAGEGREATRLALNDHRKHRAARNVETPSSFGVVFHFVS